MSKIRDEIKQLNKTAGAEVLMAAPLVSYITKKLVRTGIRESIYEKAKENGVIHEELPNTVPTNLVPTPIKSSDAPDAPVIIGYIPSTANTLESEGKVYVPQQ